MNFALIRERVRVAKRGPIAPIPVMEGAICCNRAPFVHFLAIDPMCRSFAQFRGTVLRLFHAERAESLHSRELRKKLKKVVAKLFRVVVI